MEINFDGIIGPTHHYAGLAFGNLASMHHAHAMSNPKEAALQGLKKMVLCMRLGVPQAVLPPHMRPNLPWLRALGFYGTDMAVLQQAQKMSPAVFAAAYSASSMWVANAATVSPSADTRDGRVHLTVANLMSHFHRAQEGQMNYKILKTIFSNEQFFEVHPALPSTLALGDEGAANHNRFCTDYNVRGIELFVFGRNGLLENDVFKRFPARQTLEASLAVTRLHRLESECVIIARQNPVVIDQGVFHNDVIAVANQNVLLYHDLAFENTGNVIEEIKKKFPSHCYFLNVREAALSIEESVRTYLFNSQLLTLPSGDMAIIAPQECQESKQAFEVLNEILEADNPIKHLRFVNCKESMKNGGGPACLRLRVVLTNEEKKASHPFVYLTEELYTRLVHWVHKYYRDQLSDHDLLDPSLLQESQQALDELTQILQLGSIYDFQ